MLASSPSCVQLIVPWVMPAFSSFLCSGSQDVNGPAAHDPVKPAKGPRWGVKDPIRWRLPFLQLQRPIYSVERLCDGIPDVVM